MNMFHHSSAMSNNNVLVVAAHPDDEVLGCGGTICRHLAAGDHVQILIVAEGVTSRQPQRNRFDASEALSDLSEAAHLSASILGVTDLVLLDFPDNRLDSIDRLDLIKEIEFRINMFKPSIVYVHHSGDLNIDHRRLHQAVVTACRPIPGHPVRKLFSYEVPSSTEWQPPGSDQPFHPNWFVDISEYWTMKREALLAYELEMREWPHSRSLTAIEHLARWRGAQVGVEAAEAFCLLRCLS